VKRGRKWVAESVDSPGTSVVCCQHVLGVKDAREHERTEKRVEMSVDGKCDPK
jgi:hypothetical protein